MLGCSFKSKDVWYKGPSLSLYFQFMRLVLWATFAAIIVDCLAAAYLNSFETACQNCNSFSLRLTIVNVQQAQTILSVNSFLACAAALVIAVMLQVGYEMLEGIVEQCDARPQERDYTVLLEFPDCTYLLSDVHKVLNIWWTEQCRRNSNARKLQ